MKKVNFTVFERLTIIELFGEIGKTNSIKMRQVFKIIDILDLTELQRKKIGFKQTPAGFGWESEKSKKIDRLEFEFEDADFDLIKQTVNEKDRRDDLPVHRLVPPMVDKIRDIE